MNVTPPSNYSAADVPLDLLASDKALTPKQKVAEVSQQFEALMLQEILKETQKTVIPSEFTDNSTAAGIYHDMVSKQLAESISKSGAFGLAKTLERQLTRQLCPASAAGPDRPAGTKPHLPPETDTARPIFDKSKVNSQQSGVESGLGAVVPRRHDRGLLTTDHRLPTAD